MWNNYDAYFCLSFVPLDEFSLMFRTKFIKNPLRDCWSIFSFRSSPCCWLKYDFPSSCFASCLHVSHFCLLERNRFFYPQTLGTLNNIFIHLCPFGESFLLPESTINFLKTEYTPGVWSLSLSLELELASRQKSMGLSLRFFGAHGSSEAEPEPREKSHGKNPGAPNPWYRQKSDDEDSIGMVSAKSGKVFGKGRKTEKSMQPQK